MNGGDKMGNIVLKCDKCNRFCVCGNPSDINAIDQFKDCGGQMLDTGIVSDEYSVISKISSDHAFLDAMIQLKKDGIIDYNLKMSQFKSQVNQQNQQQESNKPKCPTCGSTDIKKIGTCERVASVAMIGLFSKKINKSYKCLNCKYTW